MADHRADAADGLEQAILVGQVGGVADGLGDVLVEVLDLLFQGGDAASGEVLDQAGAGVVGLVFQACQVLGELLAGVDQFGELVDGRVVDQRGQRDGGGEAGDGLGVDAVVLGPQAPSLRPMAWAKRRSL